MSNFPELTTHRRVFGGVALIAILSSVASAQASTSRRLLEANDAIARMLEGCGKTSDADSQTTRGDV